MRQLFPRFEDDVDAAALYTADDRPTPVGRPWVLLNMITSVDGATALDGLSGGLGTPADRIVFRALRGLADIVVAAAGTVRAEGYGPPRTAPDVEDARVARGQTPHPRIAVVSGSLSLDLSSPLFTQTHPPPLVITGAGADQARRVEVARTADLLLAGDERRVDLPEAFAALAELGMSTALVEGGPGLNGQLIEAGLVDEVCLSVAPVLAGGDSRRMVHGAELSGPFGLHLDRVLEADGLLLFRYVRSQ